MEIGINRVLDSSKIKAVGEPSTNVMYLVYITTISFKIVSFRRLEN